MCGRYYIEIEDDEMRDMINRIAEETVGQTGGKAIKTSGEVFPADIVPVRTGVLQYRPMKWGFTGFNSRPVINARSETALEKPMFREPMREHRCLIPACGYYEWQKTDGGREKTKYRIFLPGDILFFAGCYRLEKGSLLPHFVILTRQAAGGAEAIHDRMPVILPEKHARTWLHESPHVQTEAITALTYRIA